MPAGSYNIVCEQGATFGLHLTYEDANGDAVNLNGYTARMQVRAKKNSPTTILSLTHTSGIALGGAAGTIIISIDASTTSSLEPNDYVYDLELIAPTTSVTRLLQGRFRVTGEVTK